MKIMIRKRIKSMIKSKIKACPYTARYQFESRPPFTRRAAPLNRGSL